MNDPSRAGPDSLLPGAAELPRFVQIEPVGQCNLRCRMCPIQFRADGSPGRPAFMDFAVFCRLIEQFPQLTELHLQGMGEPLLHPRFFDMVRHASARGIEVSTNSNLTVLSERRALECARSGLRRIHVSLDGASAQTYEYIRVRSRFDRVVRNVARLARAREVAGVALPEICLVAVAMRANLHELPELVRLARDLQVERLSVQHLCHDFGESSLPAQYRPMRAFVEQQTLLAEEPARVERYFAAARAMAAELAVDLRLPNLQPQQRTQRPPTQRCDWPRRGAYMSFAGEAMPCCMVATPDRINFGNMAQAGVEQVWNNAAYRQFRGALESEQPPEICRSCALYNGTF